MGKKGKKEQASMGLVEAAAAGALSTVEALLAVEDVDVNEQDEEGNTALYVACANGHVDVVTCLLAADAQVDVEIEEGWRPLHAAAKSGHTNAIQLLVESGADICTVTTDGSSVLHIAAAADSEDVVRYLLQEKSVSVEARNEIGRTPLHVAANDGSLNAVRLLVDAGAELDAKDEDDQTPLFRSAVSGHVQIVTFLLEQGADVDAVETDGWTLLHGAAQSGDIEMIKLLVDRGADLHALTNDERSELHIAAGNGVVEAVEFFVQNGLDVNATDDDGQTALYQAAVNGHGRIVQYLLDQGADIDVAENDGWLPLHGAAQSGDLETIELLIERDADLQSLTNDKRSLLHIAATSGSAEVVEYFVQKELDVNATDENDQTPLFQAAQNGHLQIATFLVGQGADVNAVEAQGWQPLHGAAESGDVKTIEWLIKHGADLHSRTKNERTALHIAAENGADEAVEYFVRQGLDVDGTNEDEQTALFKATLNGHAQIVEFLLEHGAEVNAADSDGWLPLHGAAQSGDMETIELLVQHGADLPSLTNDGRSVLYIAADNGADEAIEYFVQQGLDVNGANEDEQTAVFKAAVNGHAQIVEFLLEHGAEVNAVETDGWTPLHGAAESGDMETIELLVQRGADVHSLTKNGRTVLHIAAEFRADDAVEFFVRCGVDVNVTGWDEQTALFKSAARGRRQAVECLVAHSADVNIAEVKGWLPLHVAAQTGDVSTIELLLKHGAVLNSLNRNGGSALHTAIDSGKRDATVYLLNRGAVVNNDHMRAWKPVHVAAKQGDLEVIELLVKHGADLHSQTMGGRTALHIAALNGADDTVEYLVRQGLDVKALDVNGQTALFKAALKGNRQIVEFLLRQGAEIVVADTYGWLPLHAAAQSGDVETIELLVQHGADLESLTNDGQSMLLIAAANGSEGAVKFLIQELNKNNADQHAQINQSDEDGWTAVHYAAKSGNLQTMKVLVENSADLHALTKTGESALFVAAANGMSDIIQFLIDNGMDVNQVDEEDGWSVLHAAASFGSVDDVELLVQAGADIHAKDKDGESVLYIAGSNGQMEVVAYLVGEGVDINVINESDGWTVIHSAASGGSIPLLKYLIDHGADAHAAAKDGKTALHVAVSEGEREAAQYLLQKDVDVNSVDCQGRTALHYVGDTEDSHCVSLLLSAGAMTCLHLPDNDGNCPVHLTAAAHSAEETKQLLEAGANVQALTKDGKSPLQLAVFAPTSESAVSTLHALCGFGAEWTPSCQDQLMTIASDLETSESDAQDDCRQQLQWCQGLRACVLHWEQQHYKGADKLIKVPLEVIERGGASVRTYLADATNSNVAHLTYRCKVCVVGPSEWGKSSLVRSIEAMKPFLMHIRDRTVGIDIVSSSFTEDPEPAVEGASPEGEDQDPDVSSSVAVAPGKRHEVSFWDFAGQDVYQVAHALFFSRRTLYVLVIDLEAYTEQLDQVASLRITAAEAAMDRFLSRYVFRWVRTIFARQPDAEFIVLGTKADLLQDEKGQADLVWRDLQSRIFQWKLNYMRELEKEIGIASSTKSRSNNSGHVRVLKEKLNRLGSDKWLTVSVTRRDSIQAVRQAFQRTIETSERGFPMWNKYSRVLQAVANKRAAANRPGDGQHRLEHGMMLFRSLCRQLMDEVDGLEYDECRDILRTLHDLGDVIWYEHEESGQLRDFIILDPMLVIDIVREVISHEHTKKTSASGRAEDEHAQPRIDGRVDHKLLETFPLWKDMDKELLFAFKMLLKHFQLAYPANDEVMDPESDLIVPSYWKVQLEAAAGSQELAKSSLKSDGFGAGLLTQFTWEYEISADLSDSIFEQFAVQSYTSFMTRTVRANCIESSCAEFESRITQHRGDSKHDVIRVEVSGENADLVWLNMRFYLMKLEKVLDGYSGLAVPRYVVVNDKRHSLGPVVKAVRDMILLGRDPNTLRAEMPWMPPDLEWFINRAWRDIASFQELQMMHLVRDKVAVLQKLVVKGESQRRYPALWSLEYRSEQRIAVLRMLSDLSGKCYHVPIEIEVPPAFLAKHGTKLQDGVSLLSNVLPNFLSVPILQTAIDCAASALEGKVQQATQVHNLIERLNVTTTSDNVFKTSVDSGLSPSGTMAVLRDLLKIYNDSLDELSITEICNLECAATSKGEYVWAHTQEISLLKDQLTRCQPQYVAPPALESPSSSTASTVTASPISPTPSSTKNELSGASKELPGLSLCIETVVGLPDWDWYKTYCTWQLFYANSKTPLASGATTNNADSDTQPSWRSLQTPLGEMMSAEMLHECRLAVQVKRRSRVGWTKFIGEGEIVLRPLVSYDKAKNRFHCHPIQVLLSQERGSAERLVHCQITTGNSLVANDELNTSAAPVA